MVKNQIIVTSVVSQGLGVRATAKKYGVSPAWVSTLVKRYRAEGPSAFEPRSKRPKSNPLATPPDVEDLSLIHISIGVTENARCVRSP